jgi:diguanylate cyclase (GGDEF)-like protein
MMHYSHYALPSLISVVVMLILFIFVFLFRRQATGGWQFLGLVFTCVIWALGNALSILYIDEGQKLLWYNLSQIGPDFGPVFWFFLVLEHTGRKHLFQRKWLYAVLILPVITTVLMWTNDAHHLMRKDVLFNVMNDGSVYISTLRGLWVSIEFGYAYILLGISFVMLFYFLKWSSFKTQTWILIIGFIPPIFSNIMDMFNANPLQPFGPASIYFSISGIIFAWGLFCENFLRIMPIARNKVLECIGDGVIVLNKDNLIVDINPAGMKIFLHDQIKELIGRDIRELIPAWPASDAQLDEDLSLQIDLQPSHEQLSRSYSMKLSRLTDTNESFMGWAAIMHDITREIETNNRLQDQLDEIKNLQDDLRTQALQDPLTDCFNRRYLEKVLAMESSRAIHLDHMVGLLMMDIDYFKQINDQFGHQTGDQVLRETGKLLREEIRLGDIVFRYGGEEFLIIFPGINETTLKTRAHDLCEKIASMKVTASGGDVVQITVSAGMAIFPEHEKNIEDVLNHADEALYVAKRAGRNTVHYWGDLNKL